MEKPWPKMCADSLWDFRTSSDLFGSPMLDAVLEARAPWVHPSRGVHSEPTGTVKPSGTAQPSGAPNLSGTPSPSSTAKPVPVPVPGPVAVPGNQGLDLNLEGQADGAPAASPTSATGILDLNVEASAGAGAAAGVGEGEGPGAQA